MENKKLSLCIMTKTEVYAQTIGCYINSCRELTEIGVYNVEQKLCAGQSDLPKGRSQILTEWYEASKNGDLFLFIDADQTFTTADILTAIDIYKRRKCGLVCGGYAKSTGHMTLNPKDRQAILRDGEGELFYGATGFMLIPYDTVETIVKYLGNKIFIDGGVDAYPFFYHRIVSEPEIKREKLWLGEDFSFCWLAREVGYTVYGFINKSIGHIIPTERFLDYTENFSGEKDITIFCGQTLHLWDGDSKDVGGSELAVIKLSQLWVSKGYRVVVYTNCKQPGKYNGVEYKCQKTFNPTGRFNILIIWRLPEIATVIDFNCKKLILDLHDLITPDRITEKLVNKIDKVMFKSVFHSKLVNNIPENKFAVIPNGGAYDYNIKPETRDNNYLIYASSYDRGLLYMLKWGWPKIKKACPDAYLKLYYGWESFDIYQPDNEEVKLYKKTMLELMSQDGIEECGRVSREKLLLEKSKANIHYYLGDFQETDCISVRESACLGTIPVVSDTVDAFSGRDYLIKISGDPKIQKTQEEGANLIIKLLKNKEYCKQTREKLKVPITETWDYTADKWIEVFNE